MYLSCVSINSHVKIYKSDDRTPSRIQLYSYARSATLKLLIKDRIRFVLIPYYIPLYQFPSRASYSARSHLPAIPHSRLLVKRKILLKSSARVTKKKLTVNLFSLCVYFNYDLLFKRLQRNYCSDNYIKISKII